jgi:trehalose 6-phosphate synthase
MSRVVLVSNRVLDLNNAVQAGGVAVALADVLRAQGGLWFGWSGEICEPGGETRHADFAEDGNAAVATVPLTSDEYQRYYLGYSNSVLWPVFHNRLDLARFDAGFFNAYVDVNRRLAQALHRLLRPDDVIWIHDYHTLCRGVAPARRCCAVGFIHIPFPPDRPSAPSRARRARPRFSAYDLIGLRPRGWRTSDAMRRPCMAAAAGRAVFRAWSRWQLPSASTRDGAGNPSRSVAAPGAAHRIDRLDYTKGLPQKFRAFGRFLDKYPDYRRKVILSQIAPPTRESVEVTRTSARAGAARWLDNGRHGELTAPIHYIHRPIPRDNSATSMPLAHRFRRRCATA